MSCGDAGIGPKGRLAKRYQRAFGISCLLQAGGRAGIEEAVGQHPDMQCSREARQHCGAGKDPQLSPDAAEFCRYAVERLGMRVAAGPDSVAPARRSSK